MNVRSDLPEVSRSNILNGSALITAKIAANKVCIGVY